MKKALIFLIVFSACISKQIFKKGRISECQYIYSIPKEGFTPVNENWIINIENGLFQVREIEKFRPNSLIDSLYIIKPTFVLGLSSEDIKNDSIYTTQTMRIPRIQGNLLIDRNDTFLIQKYLNNKSCLVHKKQKNEYRLYRFY